MNRYYVSRTVFIYIAILFLGIILYLLTRIFPQISQNVFFFTLISGYVLILPGYLLSEIFPIFLDDFVGQLLTNFVLSVAFYLLIGLIAILFNLNINLLLFLYFLLLIIFFVIAFIITLKRDKNTSYQFSLITKLSNESIYFILPIALGVFIIYIVNFIGANLNGDPFLHLSIIRKAIETPFLSIKNLSLASGSNNLAYIYPVWHLFLASLAKFFSLDIFTVWSKITVLFTIFSFCTWYYLSKMIFNKVSWAVLGGLFFMIFTFYSGPGYLFSRLSVPDTFCQFVLLPLAWAFFLKYIFDKTKNILIIILFITLNLLLIHSIHYLYLLLSVCVFILIYTICYFRSVDFKISLIKISKAILAILFPAVLAAIIFEIHSQIISKMLSEFSRVQFNLKNMTFSRFRLLQKYTFLFLPLVLLYIKKKRIIFLASLTVLTPLIYWTPLKFIFAKLFSTIFVERLQDNTNLYFLIFAFVFIGLLVIVNTVASISKITQRYLIFGLVIFALLIVFIDLKNQSVTRFTNLIFYSKQTQNFINSNIWLLLLIIIILSLVIFLLSKHFVKLFSKNSENIVLNFLIIGIISFVLLSPDLSRAAELLKKPLQLKGENYFLNLLGNDKSAIEFVNTNIPQQSVILANAESSKALAVLSHNHLAYSPGTTFENRFNWVFDNRNPDLEKVNIVTDPKWAIDYIYLVKPKRENSHFQAHPEIYQLVYQDQLTEIYKIIK